MTECWANDAQIRLEPNCYRECFLRDLIKNIQSNANGKIYSVVSLNEIFKTSHNGGNNFKKKYQKNVWLEIDAWVEIDI